MKISVFYEHIEKACEQTKKPLEEVLAHVKKSGIDGIEMDYDMLSSNDDEQSILTSLKESWTCHKQHIRLFVIWTLIQKNKNVLM